MSAYTNGLTFQKHSEAKLGKIINELEAEQKDELNVLILE